MKGKTMTSIRVILLAGAAAIVMTVPAAASLAISGKTDAQPVKAPVVQYAQDFSHGSSPVDYGYKSKKSKTSKTSKKSKTGTTGQAKSTK